MPHFTKQSDPRGPILNAIVGVSAERENALKLANITIPKPVPIQALIDTGASSTCIDPSVLKQLNLTPTGSVQMNTPSTGTQPVDAEQYDVGLLIPVSADHVPFLSPTLPVLCVELLVAQGFHALIGRDILEHCVFTYNGTTKLYTLAY